MKDITIRCLVALSSSTAIACSADGTSAEFGDEVEATETMDTDASAESTDSMGSMGSMGSTDSTDSTDPTESTESAETTDPLDDSDDSGDSTDSESSSTTDGPPPDLPPPLPDPNENIPPLDVEGCPGIYAQDLFPTFEITMTDEVWDALVDEWLEGPDLDKEDDGYKLEHPLESFVYEDIVIDDAMVRLRGNSIHWENDDKLEFQIDFNEVDKAGRFLGLRHLALDAATANRHMLRDRLALSIMRDMDIDAPCANNARLNINGEYYGIYTSIEKIDKTFLERVFDDPEGDLWKRAEWTLKTNENTSNDDRLEDLLDADSPAELEEYLDLEQALRVFAAEAILPDSDGMWAGGLNFYLYDEPIDGKFVMLPWDLDNTFERFDDPPNGEYPVNPDPVVWEKWTSHGRPFYTTALEDEDWFAYYIAAIQDQYDSSYDADELHDLIDDWSAQIEDAVVEDDNKPYSNNDYFEEVEDLHDYIDDRHDFLAEWLECWQNGGEPDGQGYCVQ
jgi:spore coat protein CotH